MISFQTKKNQSTKWFTGSGAKQVFCLAIEYDCTAYCGDDIYRYLKILEIKACNDFKTSLNILFARKKADAYVNKLDCLFIKKRKISISQENKRQRIKK